METCVEDFFLCRLSNAGVPYPAATGHPLRDMPRAVLPARKATRLPPLHARARHRACHVCCRCLQTVAQHKPCALRARAGELPGCSAWERIRLSRRRVLRLGEMVSSRLARCCPLSRLCPIFFCSVAAPTALAMFTRWSTC